MEMLYFDDFWKMSSLRGVNLCTVFQTPTQKKVNIHQDKQIPLYEVLKCAVSVINVFPWFSVLRLILLPLKVAYAKAIVCQGL